MESLVNNNQQIVASWTAEDGIFDNVNSDEVDLLLNGKIKSA